MNTAREILIDILPKDIVNYVIMPFIEESKDHWQQCMNTVMLDIDSTKIFEALVKERLEKQKGYFFDVGDRCRWFNDDPDVDDCRGWDGVSKRCDCGNRKVNWAMEKDCDGDFFVQPEW